MSKLINVTLGLLSVSAMSLLIVTHKDAMAMICAVAVLSLAPLSLLMLVLDAVFIARADRQRMKALCAIFTAFNKVTEQAEINNKKDAKIIKVA